MAHAGLTEPVAGLQSRVPLIPIDDIEAGEFLQAAGEVLHSASLLPKLALRGIGHPYHYDLCSPVGGQISDRRYDLPIRSPGECGNRRDDDPFRVSASHANAPVSYIKREI